MTPALTSARTRILLQAATIAVAVLIIYFPVFQGDWLWDDGLLIRQNALVHDPEGLWKIWFQPNKLIDYLPITVSVEWLEWQLWHANTLGYHLTNVGLHILSALLVWRLFSKLNLRLAWLGGLLFAIHPAMVESVAWIAELKNTLSMPFFLLSMIAWIDYDREGRRRDYFQSLGLFLIAMLCKATMVMFPVVILLYAWWRRSRIRWRDLKDSAPFFTVSLILGVITLKFLHPAMAEKSIELGGLPSRLALAGTVAAFYFFKSVWPIGLLPIYPKWSIHPTSLPLFLPWLILTGVLMWCWARRLTWGRHLLLGLGFFLINLAPFVGFTPAAYMAFTWTMDHILYVPILGLIGLAVAACGRIEEWLPPNFRLFSIGALTVIMLLAAVASRNYASIFMNQETLWTYELHGNPDSEVAHNNLGLVFLNSNRLPEAITQFEMALKIKEDYAFAHNGLGNALVLSNRVSEAIAHYQTALRINPEYPEAHNGLGNALLRSGRTAEARAEFELSLKFNPNYAEAHCNLGLIYAAQGKNAEAIQQFETAQQLRPGDARIAQKLEYLRAQKSK